MRSINKWSVYALLAPFLLSGCTMQTLGEGLPLLKGRSIERAAEILGNPSSLVEMPTYNVYVWNNGETLRLDLPDTSYSSTGETIYGTKQSAYDLNCKIEITTNKLGIIRKTEAVGDFISCERFAKRIKRIIPDD